MDFDKFFTQSTCYTGLIHELHFSDFHIMQKPDKIFRHSSLSNFGNERVQENSFIISV